jgi:ubiquinone/menaquinone biosynthesis C-methylase UbiE
MDSLFGRGDLILDLGCGTGEDAIHFRSRGVQVYAIDASAAMVRIARERGVNAHQGTVEAIAKLDGKFNGVLSNFGVLNCVHDLPSVGCALSRLVVTGGVVAICVMSSFCLRETLHFLIHGNLSKAFRRLRRGKVRSSLGLDIHYPSAAQLRSAFSDHFELIGWYGVGLCVPPSYVRGINGEAIDRRSKADRCLAHLPVLRAMADHRLFLFKRL